MRAFLIILFIIPVMDRARLQRAIAHKRRRTLIKKADEFRYLCEAEVYLVLYKNSKFYVYSSQEENTSWPPSMDKIVIHLSPSFILSVH